MNINSKIELTFRQLAEYDDVATDLLDGIYGFVIHKVNPHYRSKRANQAILIQTIRNLVVNKDLDQACNQYLETQEWTKAFFSRKPNEQIQGFKDHLKRYLAMFLPNAGFEVSQTARYDTEKLEVKVISTKHWNAGDEIKFCSGYVAVLTPDEEIHLTDISKRDFSVMFSTKKKSNCLFLGPARFVNHDCNANTKFISCGANSVCFKAVRDIEPLEEITSFYGENYFGEANAECQCETCEKLMRGYFSPDRQQNEQNDSGSSLDSGNSTPGTEVSQKRIKRTASLFEKLSKITIKPSTNGIECTTCGRLSNSSILLTPEAKKEFICTDCTTHLRIFGVTWPRRDLVTKQTLGNSIVENHTKRDTTKSKTTPISFPSSSNLASPFKLVPRSLINKSGPPSLSKLESKLLVFVDPQDPSEKYWWPAMVVPTQEIDSSMPTAGEGECVVRYFEDNSFSCVSHRDIIEFLPTKEPFLTFYRKYKEFENDSAVRRALVYYETSVLPDGFKWKNWTVSKADEDIVKLSPATPVEYSKIANTKDLELRYDTNSTVTVNHGERKYIAKILKGEIWPESYEKGVGPHYYVHYAGWSKRHDEWVPQCRISASKLEKTTLPMKKIVSLSKRSSIGSKMAATCAKETELTSIEEGGDIGNEAVRAPKKRGRPSFLTNGGKLLMPKSRLTTTSGLKRGAGLRRYHKMRRSAPTYSSSSSSKCMQEEDNLQRSFMVRRRRRRQLSSSDEETLVAESVIKSSADEGAEKYNLKTSDNTSNNNNDTNSEQQQENYSSTETTKKPRGRPRKTHFSPPAPPVVRAPPPIEYDENGNIKRKRGRPRRDYDYTLEPMSPSKKLLRSDLDGQIEVSSTLDEHLPEKENFPVDSNISDASTHGDELVPNETNNHLNDVKNAIGNAKESENCGSTSELDICEEPHNHIGLENISTNETKVNNERKEAVVRISIKDIILPESDEIVLVPNRSEQVASSTIEELPIVAKNDDDSKAPPFLNTNRDKEDSLFSIPTTLPSVWNINVPTEGSQSENLDGNSIPKLLVENNNQSHYYNYNYSDSDSTEEVPLVNLHRGPTYNQVDISGSFPLIWPLSTTPIPSSSTSNNSINGNSIQFLRSNSIIGNNNNNTMATTTTTTILNAHTLNDLNGNNNNNLMDSVPPILIPLSNLNKSLPSYTASTST